MYIKLGMRRQGDRKENQVKMGITQDYTPAYGIIVSAFLHRVLIKKLFGMDLPDDKDLVLEHLEPAKNEKYSMLTLPHDIEEALGENSPYVFIGVADVSRETPYGYSCRHRNRREMTSKLEKSNEVENEDKTTKRLEFGEGLLFKWENFKETYDALETELKSKYEPIEGHQAGFFFIPDDCLCCT